MDKTEFVLSQINNILSRVAKSKTEDEPEENKIKQIPVGDEKRLRQLLETDYSVAYKKFLDGKAIFRGVKYSLPKQLGKYTILKPGLKASQFVELNLYTRLFSGILPSWQDYPPRNKSFICTSSTEKAVWFASPLVTIETWENNVYAVLPKNGADIAICPVSDIWSAFPYVKNLKILGVKYPSLPDFQTAFMSFVRFICLTIYELVVKEVGKSISRNPRNKYFRLAIVPRLLNDALEYASDTSITAIFNTISNHFSKYIDDIAAAIENNDPITKLHGFKVADRRNCMFFIEELRKYNTTNLLEYLDIVLNARTNGFKKVKIENYNVDSIVSDYVRESGQEVWTDSECLFVNRLYLESFK